MLYVLKMAVYLTLSPPIPLRLYTLLYWSKPPFLIFDIRAHWRSGWRWIVRTAAIWNSWRWKG